MLNLVSSIYKAFKFFFGEGALNPTPFLKNPVFTQPFIFVVFIASMVRVGGVKGLYYIYIYLLIFYRKKGKNENIYRGYSNPTTPPPHPNGFFDGYDFN